MQHRNSNRDLCSAGTITFSIIPSSQWLCRKQYPCLGEAGYESDYSWAITSTAMGCAFMIGCTIEKRPDNYFFMIIPSWWLWMIIAIQGERVFFFFEKWKLEAFTELLLVTYIQRATLCSLSFSAWQHLSVCDSYKRPVEAKCASSWQIR